MGLNQEPSAFLQRSNNLGQEIKNKKEKKREIKREGAGNTTTSFLIPRSEGGRFQRNINYKRNKKKFFIPRIASQCCQSQMSNLQMQHSSKSQLLRGVDSAVAGSGICAALAFFEDVGKSFINECQR